MSRSLNPSRAFPPYTTKSYVRLFETRYFFFLNFFPSFLPSLSSSLLRSSLRGSGQPSSSSASGNFSRLRPVFFFSFFYFPSYCSSISSNRKTLNPKPPPLENPNTLFNLQNWDPDSPKSLAIPPSKTPCERFFAITKNLSPIAQYICDSFWKHRNWGPPVVADLNKLRRVTPVLVAEVLKVQTEPVICSKFFHWAGNLVTREGTLRLEVRMDNTKLLSLLKTCINSKSLKQGKLIHQKIVSLGLQNNIILCKNLITLYFSCHLFQPAKLVFQTIDNPLDITLWNGLMAAYTKNFIFIETLELFHRLLHFPYLKPDAFTYPSVLKACSGLGRVGYGKMVHTHVIKSGLGMDVVVMSSVVGMYAKCNLFEDAIKLFDEMPERDVVSWNNVISCYYQDGQPEKALELFEEMKVSGFEPNSVTLTTAISSCARLFDLERGKEIHKELMRSGFVLDGFVSSALVDMYGKCGCLEMAKETFGQIQRKNVVSWNSMIAGYSLKGDSESCIDLFRRMHEEGITPTLTTLSSILMACSRSVKLRLGKFIHGYIIRNRVEADIFVDSSLTDLYFKCGNIASAENVFQNMPKTNVVSWNVMISGYMKVGSYLEALGIFTNMRKTGVKPDAVTFTSVLPACSQLGVLERGKEIHNFIIESKLESNEVVVGALLDMYAKCGAVDEALHIFNQLPQRDFVSWTSMIAAYGSHGQAFEALNLFEKMQQSDAKLDKVTFLAILSACSHAGLVGEGCYYFNQMITEYGFKPAVEHYSCLIDLLGRVGRLQEAYEILQRTPDIREDVGLLSTLFSACRLHKEIDLGEKIGRLLIEKDPNDPSTYIILSNMYASVKKWDEVRKVRLKIKALGLKKNPGCSWIEVGKRIHPFVVEDKSHPQADMIYECMSILASHMENYQVLSL